MVCLVNGNAEKKIDQKVERKYPIELHPMKRPNNCTTADRLMAGYFVAPVKNLTADRGMDALGAGTECYEY